jgi:hypothetical protein
MSSALRTAWNFLLFTVIWGAIVVGALVAYAIRRPVDE